MSRYFVEIAYKGSNFHGWQIQPNAITVQEELEQKISIVLQEEVKTVGCGRTDTGVHAKQFYLHFDIDHLTLELQLLKYKLNHLLSDDISVHRIIKVDQELHARFSAISRTYRYYINREKDPFKVETSWFFSQELDVPLMRKALLELQNHTDFSSFSKLHTDTKTNICQIFKAEINEFEGGQLELIIEANRFLRNMVRAIVGTVVDVGQGKTSLSEFRSIIESKNRNNAGSSAPAKGLFLWEIKYPQGAI